MIGYLTKDEEDKVVELSKRIKFLLNDQLVFFEIFGSKVMGNFTPDSDIDILIVVKNKNSELKNKLYDILFEIDPYYEYKISLIVYSIYEYEQNIKLKSTFIENLQRYGITLWMKNLTLQGIV